jgi:hypothetical protein
MLTSLNNTVVLCCWFSSLTNTGLFLMLKVPLLGMGYNNIEKRFPIHFGLYIISDPDKLESFGKRCRRPKQAGPALSC